MKQIAIISASVRTGRKSHRTTLYLKNYIEENNLAQVEIIDLQELDFPVFHERLKNLQAPPAQALAFAESIKASDGVIIVTPEYNGGYPASLKNVIDLLYAEWKRKPIAIATVSSGAFGGSQVITSLQFSLWKIGALMVPAMFPTPKVDELYDEDGKPKDKESLDKRAKGFIDELLWVMEAKSKME